MPSPALPRSPRPWGCKVITELLNNRIGKGCPQRPAHKECPEVSADGDIPYVPASGPLLAVLRAFCSFADVWLPAC